MKICLDHAPAQFTDAFFDDVATACQHLILVVGHDEIWPCPLLKVFQKSVSLMGCEKFRTVAVEDRKALTEVLRRVWTELEVLGHVYFLIWQPVSVRNLAVRTRVFFSVRS